MRSRREVGCHDRSCPSEERPGRCHHPAEANRHEVGETTVVLRFQGFQGAAETERRVDDSEPAPRCALPRLAAHQGHLGDSADTLIVTARTTGGQRDKTGVGVFIVPATAAGITRKGYPTQDGLHAADITFTGVEVGADSVIGDPKNGLPLIERVVDEARVALCAEAVGLMDESLKTTVEYIKTRKQFGVPIGSFQALQHRAADMFVALEQARSMSMFATMAGEFDDTRERATAIAAAKVQIGKSGKFVGQQSIQLHGGIGMTIEAKIGHYFKRLSMIESTFGDTDYHQRRVAEAGSLI